MKLTTRSTIKLSSGFRIPVIGLGVYQLPAADTERITYSALEAGYRHIDSAQLYRNEKQVVDGISRFLENHHDVKREEIFYTTKVAVKNFGYDAAKKSIEESLRLAESIGYIDLFLVHAPLGGPKKRLETYKALQEFVPSGDIKSLGVSNYGIQHIEELLSYPDLDVKPSVNQIELNPWLTRKDLVDYMSSVDIVAEAFSPLVRGKKFNDRQLAAMAKKYRATPAQILIKWSLEKGFVPLPKTATEARLGHNLKALEIEMTADDLDLLTHDESYELSQPAWDPSIHKN